jgi:hypothetical protein
MASNGERAHPLAAEDKQTVVSRFEGWATNCLCESGHDVQITVTPSIIPTEVADSLVTTYAGSQTEPGQSRFVVEQVNWVGNGMMSPVVWV